MSKVTGLVHSWRVEKPHRLLKEVKNQYLSGYTTKDLKWSIEHNRCFVNNIVERFCSAPLKKGDLVSIWARKCPVFTLEKKRILFEDSAILIYDKSPFLASEQLADLANCLLVHRLDRDTSGVFLLAKNRDILSHLERQFRQRTVHKEYRALVEGKTGHAGNICGNMAPAHRRQGAVMWRMSSEGLWSQTRWKLLRYYHHTSLLQCIPTTGRTHQIRVHLKHIGHPIVGDYTYGPSAQRNTFFRPLLHAYRLSFLHPITQKQCTFSANPPEDFNLDGSL